MNHHHDDSPSRFSLVHFARAMRREPTRSEAMLWEALRRRAVDPRFRRQHPMHPFVVDFYCPSYRLVVEVDGSVHDEPEVAAHDVARHAWLEATFGVRFLRLPAALVERDLAAALAQIRAVLQ
jgi:very-short-patch-repair endonuclease